jgi:Alpha/beta hydrolase domain
MSVCRFLRFSLALAALVAFSVVGFGGMPASGATADQLLAPTATPAGTFAGVSYVQYDGIFEGETSTGAFRVPYRITAPADASLGNGTVVVEPSHFAVGLGVLNLYLRRELLFTRGFAHAGIGWSTTSFGPGQDNRILDPTVPGTFIDGGSPDHGGRTDHEIIADFARALTTDPQADAMLGHVARRYATGVSDSSYPVMDLVTSGLGANVFDLAFPITTEWKDPQPAIQAGVYDGKLVIVNSEFDKSGKLVDRGVARNQYRFYAAAGTPHVPDHLEIPSFASRSTPASYEFALRAHFLQGDRWVRRGTPPPASYHLKTQGNTIERDGSGNAITVNASGQPVPRLPFIELGEARFVTGFVGSYDNVNTLADLGFQSHAAYLKAFKSKVDDYLSAGYILPEEATAMRSRAALCPPMTYTQTYRDQYDKFVAIQSCTG